jgi:hypothetical protein
MWCVGRVERRENVVYDRPFNVMLDPSLLLVDEQELDETMRQLGALREQYSLSNIFAPDTLRTLVESPSAPEETIRRFVEYYVPPSERETVLSVESVLDRLYSEDVVRFFTVSPEQRGRYGHFYSNLLEELPEEAELSVRAITPTVFEEWVFLQEQSWVVARLERTFRTMRDAGALIIEGGKRTVDDLTRRALHRGPADPITQLDRLRVCGKWIAVGGAPLLQLVHPLAGALVGSAGGLFCLLDP